jgi:hypothetical protein
MSMHQLARVVPAVLCAVIAAIGFKTIAAPAQPAPPRGIVIHASGSSTSAETALASEFTKLEAIGMTSTFTFADGKTLQMQPTSMMKVFMYPDLAAMTLINEQDAAKLHEQKAQMATLSKQYPRSASILAAQVAKIDETLARMQQGNVFVGGRWMTRQEYQQASTGQSNSYVAVLTVGGQVYKNAKASALEGDQLKIMHDGGFATLSTARLTPVQRQELARTSPNIGRVLAPEIAGSLPAPTTRSGNSFSIVTDLVTIQLPGGAKTYPLDQVPASLLQSDPTLAAEVALRLKAKQKNQNANQKKK